MPVVAVVGGIMAASAGVTAFTAAAATAAGVAGMSVSAMVVAGLQVVGGIASALGAVTGNEKLMKVGMVASLGASAVNGLSGLSSGAVDAAPSGAADATKSIMGGAPAGDYAAFAAKTADTAGNALVKNIGGAADALTTSSVADIAKSVGSNSSPLSGGLLGSAASTAAPVGVPAAPPKIPVAGPPVKTPAPTGAPTSVFNKISTFANANPEMTKLGMGMLSGFGTAYSEQEKLKAAERMEASKRQRINDSINGIQSAF